MTDAFQPFSAQSASPDIETVYTTAAPQGESTDWLTVVRNLRQSNRKLLDQVEALEQVVAEAKNDALSHQERCRVQGIKIVQQDDDLQVAQERVRNLFEQLENSHHIGQRQQILVETLSQKLEIAQTIIAELESENNQLKHTQADREQRLGKAEAVAQELYRRLRQQLSDNSAPSLPNNASTGIPKVQISVATEEDFDESTQSGPLEFEVESIRSSWPAPAIEAAAEMKARPQTAIDLPKFNKKPAQS
jgi:chromosome segregation ATPase